MTADDTRLLVTLQAAASGHAGAVDSLLELTYPRVRELVHRRLDSDFRRSHRWILPLFSTRDIVQDVLRGVLKDIEDTNFDSEEGFVAYLGTVVRNRLLDAVRFHEAGRRDARRAVGEPEEGIGSIIKESDDAQPPFAAELREQLEVVRSVMDEMPERQRMLVEMRTVDQKTYPEICESLGYSSAETARQAFATAQAKVLVRLRSRGVEPC